MSKFFSDKFKTLEAYVPGEQPQDKKYIKLNTNESPFPPAADVVAAVAKEAGSLNLYSDPDSKALTAAVAKKYGFNQDQVLMTNGSDEILYLAFMAYSDGFVFPNITYGFYKVLCNLLDVPYETIALKDDFSIDYREYCGINKNIVFANPNAPTGIAMPLSEVEEIIKTNSNNIVIVDEAYIDFADSGISCVDLINKYDNLLVTMTFSKSRSLAGARIGVGFANPEIIKDLNTLKNSFAPYNISKINSVAGIAAIENDKYYMDNCKVIAENRNYLTEKLKEEGFTVLPSMSNFVFAKDESLDGGFIYEKLKDMGVLVRHFSAEELKDFNRITVGTKEQIDILLSAIRTIKNG